MSEKAPLHERMTARVQLDAKPATQAFREPDSAEKSIRTTVYFPESLLLDLKYCAIEERTSVSGLLNRLAAAYISGEQL